MRTLLALLLVACGSPDDSVFTDQQSEGSGGETVAEGSGGAAASGGRGVASGGEAHGGRCTKPSYDYAFTEWSECVASAACDVPGRKLAANGCNGHSVVMLGGEEWCADANPVDTQRWPNAETFGHVCAEDRFTPERYIAPGTKSVRCCLEK